MYKYILEMAGDLDWLALLALLTFVIVFSMSIYLAFAGNKTKMSKMASLPLDNDNPDLN